MLAQFFNAITPHFSVIGPFLDKFFLENYPVSLICSTAILSISIN